MACLTDDDPEAGYATAVAAMIALGLSLVVAAVMAAALQELRFSRQAFERRQAELALDGAQLLAVQAVTRGAGADRYRWTAPSAFGEIELLAEAEAPKLSSAEAAGRDDVLEAFGVAQPGRLGGRLTAWLAGGGGALGLARLDPAVAWRRCAGSMVSPYGRGTTLRLAAAAAPTAASLDMRPAQVWRLRAAQRRGWVDERIVRFTGDPQHPAAIVERTLYRGDWMDEPCSDFIVREDRR